MTQVAGVAAVFLLLGAALWWLRRAGFAAGGRAPAGPGQAPLAERVGRLSLGPQHRLELVRLADRVLVIAVGASGCSLLETVGWSELAPPVEERAARGARR